MFRVVVYGDPHLSKGDHGSHRDYAGESFQYFKDNLDKANELNADMIIGLGDLTFGNLDHKLSLKVEELLTPIKDKHYMLKGNHDVRTDGMSQFEYYLERGLFKPAEEVMVLPTGNQIQMFDWKDNVVFRDGTEFAFMHDYVRFTNSPLPNYGKKYINLDEVYLPNSLKHLVVGHLHGQHMFAKDINNNYPIVHYPGCNARPSYLHAGMTDHGELVVIDFYNVACGDDETKFTYEIIQMPLWELHDSFNLEEIAKKDSIEQAKEDRVDLSGVVKELGEHERNIGDPEMIINGLEIDSRYKEKAHFYLKKACEN